MQHHLLVCGSSVHMNTNSPPIFMKDSHVITVLPASWAKCQIWADLWQALYQMQSLALDFLYWTQVSNDCFLLTGLHCLLLVSVVVAALLYYQIDLIYIYKHIHQFAAAATLFSVVGSVYAFARSYRAPKEDLSEAGKYGRLFFWFNKLVSKAHLFLFGLLENINHNSHLKAIYWDVILTVPILFCTAVSTYWYFFKGEVSKARLHAFYRESVTLLFLRITA